ncbi:MAG: class I SAM-dependent methyltransferase [Methanoregula sp.]|jgi:ubiquinone/menaquinone biosynthesis C-methylase UbiE|nr:class I SAM-dependent methyltransferase [Methanoregula sp.]
MEPATGAWEEDYSRRGILWGGATNDLPELPLGSRVLELGCGNGKTLSTMIQRGWDVTAIDFSSRAVSLSMERCKGKISCESIVADARQAPFKNNTFDAVFAIHIVGHLCELERILVACELAHIIKPGGILFFTDFSTDDFRYGSGFETEAATYRRGTGIITHYFSQQEVIDLFSRMRPVSISIHQWPMRIMGKNLIRSEIKGIFSK